VEAPDANGIGHGGAGGPLTPREERI